MKSSTNHNSSLTHVGPDTGDGFGDEAHAVMEFEKHEEAHDVQHDRNRVEHSVAGGTGVGGGGGYAPAGEEKGASREDYFGVSDVRRVRIPQNDVLQSITNGGEKKE